jgi:hypothetical protein
MGAVDELLAREGRLRFLTDPVEVEIERKPPGRVEQRIKRDPRDLLSLALPWVYGNGDR